jgi:hypothetical protein
MGFVTFVLMQDKPYGVFCMTTEHSLAIGNGSVHRDKPPSENDEAGRAD